MTRHNVGYLRVSILFVLILLIGVLLFGCGGGGGGGSSSGQVPTIVADCVVIASSLSEAGIIGPVNSADNNIVLDKAAADTNRITAGSVLVVPASDNCPEGVTRKIVRMTDAAGRYDVETAPAAMNDIYKQIDIAEDNVLIRPSDVMVNASGAAVRFNSIRGAIGGPKVSVKANPTNDAFTYTFTEFSLYDADGNTSTTNDAILLSGVTEVAFYRTVEYKKYAGETLPRYAKFVIQSVPKITLLRVKIGGSVSILTADFNKPIVPPFLVPIPAFASTMEVQPRVGVEIGLSAIGSYEWETDVSLSTSAGIEAWSDGRTASSVHERSIFSASLTSSSRTTTNYGVDFVIKPYVGMNFSLKLGGIIGPYAQTNAFGKYAFEFLPSVRHIISAGVEAYAGIKADIWGFINLFDVNLRLAGKEWTIYDSGSAGSVPGTVSVTPGSGSWTFSPQELSVSSSGATNMYYTMVNTYDGSTPADPREPTSSDKDGTITISGGVGTFQLYAIAGQNKRSKLRFRGYNSAGAGPASGVFSYSINLSMPVAPVGYKPTFSPPPGTYATAQSVALGAMQTSPWTTTIIYSTDGGNTTKVYTGPIYISTSTTILAASYLSGDGWISGPQSPWEIGVYTIVGSVPVAASVNPASGSWTSSPQNLSVSSNNATAIYYTMVNTYDGSTPADPREPTSSDNDGSITVSGGSGTIQLYATAGQNKRSKLRFRGYNNAGAGAASGVYSYSINLSSAPTPGPISVTPSSGSWTSSPQNLSVSSNNATAIYYTMVNTYDGSTPADPREPTSSDNDGSISVSGGEGTFLLYAIEGENKRSKLRFLGYNSSGAGSASGVYSYSINLRIPDSFYINTPSGMTWNNISELWSGVSIRYADRVYCTLRTTTDGSTPSDPPPPTPVSHDFCALNETGECFGNNGEYLTCGGGPFVLYAGAGQYKRIKIRFGGYNDFGSLISDVYSYTIDNR